MHQTRGIIKINEYRCITDSLQSVMIEWPVMDALGRCGLCSQSLLKHLNFLQLMINNNGPFSKANEKQTNFQTSARTLFPNSSKIFITKTSFQLLYYICE